MKKKLLLVYVFIAFAVLCTNVYAVITMDLNLVANNTKVEPGTDLLVTVNLKNISDAISSIEGYINIDENIIEDITEDIIVNKDGKIEVTSGNEAANNLTYAFNPTETNADYDVIFNTKRANIENNDCFFVMDLDKDIEISADILNLKFKVKENATKESVEDAVKVDCIVAYSADEADKTEPISATLDIKVVEDINAVENEVDNTNTNENVANENKNTNTNANTNTNKNTNTNNNTNTNKNTNKNTNTNKNSNKNTNTNNTNKVTNTNNTNTDGTVAGSTIPAAGARMIILPVIIFAILAYVSYNRYIKYKDI